MAQDYLKFLFSRFTDHGEIFVAVEETLRAQNVLQEYIKTGLPEYLSLCFTHVSSLLSLSGRLTGRLRQIERSWSGRLAGTYANEMGPQYHKVMGELEWQFSRLKSDQFLSSEDFAEAKLLSTRLLQFISPELFPKSSFRKLGYIIYGMLKATGEIRRELLDKQFGRQSYHLIEMGLVMPYASVPRPDEIFRREYAWASGLSYEESEIPEEWEEKYSGRPENVPHWGEDRLELLLEKIDFNGKSMGKAIVRIGGSVVCIVGALAKVASLFAINPTLNDLSIKALLIGGTLAVSPEAAKALSLRLLGKKE